jgi:mono/diheme cytochrome c family protein
MKVLKWIGIGLGVLLGVVLLAALVLFWMGNSRLNKTYQIEPETITISTDTELLARGEHLAQAICTGCHASDFSGSVIFEDPAIGKIYAANLTPAGHIAQYSDADLVRAIRHGVAKDGRQLMIMPSDAFIHFSAEDVGAIIAYLRTLPPAGSDMPKPAITPIGRIALAAGVFGQVFPAEYIDHSLPFPKMPSISANQAYGEYLLQLCTACHGEDLAGGQPTDPASPPAPNLTPGGELAGWSEADFLTTIQTGVTPSGHILDPEFMPVDELNKLDEVELQAMWVYLHSLPAR